MSPIEPPPSRWRLPSPDPRDPDDLVTIGADLEPGTLLAAYRQGLFPMPLGEGRGAPVGWWSPYRRGILAPEGLRVSRTLRRSCRRYRVSVDRAFPAVVAACADPSRPGSWITDEIASAYGELHRLGWAHSVEVWEGSEASGELVGGPELVGGLYGVAIGGLFAGESMFHRRTDASKVALVALASLLRASGGRRLIDVQWRTDHLASLGVVEVARSEYLSLLAAALRLPDVEWGGILGAPFTTTAGSPDPA